MADPALDSWIIIAVKTVIGYTDVRNKILKECIDPKYKNIVYGPTFSINGKENLNEYLDDIITLMNDNKKKIILFTCTNDFGITSKKSIETHYQTFIIDTFNRNVIMIDPSRKHTESGIYSPYAAWYIGKYIKHRIECNINWLNLKNPCQVYTKDMFCQSWSLYLLITAMNNDILNNPNYVVNIPFELEEKYKILLKFYAIVFKIKYIKNILPEVWDYLLKNNISRKDAEGYINDEINIYDEFNQFESEDLYTKPTKKEVKFIEQNYENNQIFINNNILNDREYKDAVSMEQNILKINKSKIYILFTRHS